MSHCRRVTVVLDTNVVVAALVAEGLCREVLHRGVRLRVLATSRPLLDELEATPKQKFRITPAAAAFLKALGSRLWSPCRFRRGSVATPTTIFSFLEATRESRSARLGASLSGSMRSRNESPSHERDRGCRPFNFRSIPSRTPDNTGHQQAAKPLTSQQDTEPASTC